jgi:hypothetical protein
MPAPAASSYLHGTVCTFKCVNSYEGARTVRWARKWWCFHSHHHSQAAHTLENSGPRRAPDPTVTLRLGPEQQDLCRRPHLWHERLPSPGSSADRHHIIRPSVFSKPVLDFHCLGYCWGPPRWPPPPLFLLGATSSLALAPVGILSVLKGQRRAHTHSPPSERSQVSVRKGAVV